MVAIANAFHVGKDIDGLLRVMTTEELKDVDYDLSPGRHVVPPLRQRDCTLADAREEVVAAEAAHEAAATTRRQEAQGYEPEDDAKLTGTSKLGAVPSDWSFVPLATAIEKEFAGDYGEDKPANGLSPCRVIKATNFADIAAGRLDGLVIRYIKDKTIARKRIQEHDLIIETSGGGKHQPTGRVLYVTAELAAADPPLHPTNFTRLLRIGRSEAEPRFVYHYWRLFYRLGRTQPYERQPTQIRNFKLANFLAHELIPDLKPEEQRRLAAVLDALEAEELLLARRTEALEHLQDAALIDVLCGLYRRPNP